LLNPLTAYVVCSVFVATLIRSVLGFGEALVTVPLLALRLPTVTAAPLAVLVSIAVAAGVVAQDWHPVELRSATGLILSSLPGIPLGLMLPARWQRALRGIDFGCSDRCFLSIFSDQENDPAFAWWPFGMAGGRRLPFARTRGAYGMNGAPLAIYGALRSWFLQHFRATLQGYFLPATVVGLIGYADHIPKAEPK
jgi:hypothetical protein